jgi:hypothetical protein
MKKTILITWSILICIASFAQPKITAFSPASGAIGSNVTITGTGFNTTANQNIVFFGATRAVVTAASVSSLTVTVPFGATYEAITVTNLANNLTGNSNQPFFIVTLPGNILFDAKIDFGTNTNPQSVSIGDLDGDGKPDLAVANYLSGNISIFLNTSTSGTVTFAPKIDISTGSGVFAVSINDLDGDGKPDITVSNFSSTTISVLKNISTLGSISFNPKIDFPTVSLPKAFCIGDINGDGKPEICLINGSNNISIFRNTSTLGGINFAAKLDFVTPFNPTSIAMSSLEWGTGVNDLVISNSGNNNVSVFGNPSTLSTITLGTPKSYTTGNSPYSVSIGDIDRDGKSDLVTSNYTGSSISVLRNTYFTGNGTIDFAAKVDYAVNPQLGTASIGDIDGDGKPDVVAASNLANKVSVLRNLTNTGGAINIDFPIDFNTGTNPRSIKICDIDGDGKPDIVFANYGDNTISVLRQKTPSPSVTSFNPSSACANTTPVVITGTGFTGATSVNFGGTSAISFTVNSATQITAIVGNGSTGTIDVTTPGGVSISASTFTVNPTFTISVNSGSICSGSSFTINPAGASTYTISGGSAIVSPTTNTSYNVTGTSAQGCVSSNTAVSSVTVNVKPVIAVNSGSVCSGNSFTINPTGASTYTISGGSSVVTPTTNASYNVTGTSAQGCVSSNTAVSSVTVNAKPTISVNSGSICSGNSFTINPTGASTYTISGGSSIVSPTTNVSYNITGTSAQGCVSSNTAVSSVTVNAIPVVSVNSGSICSGSSFTINPTGASTYTISGGSAIVSPITNASYNVTGTSAQGCVSSNTAVSSVTVNAIPVVSVNSGSICSGSSFTINPTGASTYSISGGSAIVSPTTNASYNVTGISAQGCVSSNTAVSSVTVNALPNITAITNNTLLCTGETTSLTATGASSYLWNTSATTSVIAISPSVTINYTVTGTDANGCSNSSTITQSVSLCTGISASQSIDASLNVYPNPSNGLFTITGIEQNAIISIYNTLGELVKSIPSSDYNTTIDLSDYSNGIYFIKIKSNKGESIQKLIKQ